MLTVASLGPAGAQPVDSPASWAAVKSPLSGPARIIGGTGLGCIAGAVALPPDGPGWQAVRVSRNRHWGHPALIDWLRDFTAAARAADFPSLWIGDLGQPRGGPMPYGHASHQAGLDADIWLELSPKPASPAAAREDIAVPSLVLADESGVDPRYWRPRHAALIRHAAEQPGLDRLLVT
ncbi:MAG: mepA, partial [Belnapia sp.]|nr:mepA [Belnapia sp.]